MDDKVAADGNGCGTIINNGLELAALVAIVLYVYSVLPVSLREIIT
jgi:hypothetical protein